MKKSEKSLNFLKVALQAEEDQIQLDPEAVDRTEHAGTHLNICAILSLLSRHTEALRTVKKAISVLGYKEKKHNNSVDQDALEMIVGEQARMNETQVKEGKTYYLMVTVAYYNLGIEYEHLSNITEALIALNTSLDVA